MVLVVSISADIVNVYVDQSVLAGALEDAAFEISGKDFRKQCEDIELHDLILLLLV